MMQLHQTCLGNPCPTPRAYFFFHKERPRIVTRVLDCLSWIARPNAVVFHWVARTNEFAFLFPTRVADIGSLPVNFHWVMDWYQLTTSSLQIRSSALSRRLQMHHKESLLVCRQEKRILLCTAHNLRFELTQFYYLRTKWGLTPIILVATTNRTPVNMTRVYIILNIILS